MFIQAIKKEYAEYINFINKDIASDIRSNCAYRYSYTIEKIDNKLEINHYGYVRARIADKLSVFYTFMGYEVEHEFNNQSDVFTLTIFKQNNNKETPHGYID